jgi:hypothetical protein
LEHAYQSQLEYGNLGYQQKSVPSEIERDDQKSDGKDSPRRKSVRSAAAEGVTADGAVMIALPLPLLI